MTLIELLEQIGGSFPIAPQAPVAFAFLTDTSSGWNVGEQRPIVGVRLGEDEILLETSDPSPNETDPRQMTAGELLTRLMAMEADYPDRPVEACEPEFDAGGGIRVRPDYEIGATGLDQATGTHLLFCLAGLE